ncbi:peptidoglycan DD-metalloendopeptidase family protein [Mucilaginibacter sp. UR6-11]|uniref:peptidoglycan DD-metalloendopeptidase family protein n=1 Tax=Mucilaginibacter sp. UR6-11 TaxID=1435644 RepID=UPI001E545F8E|nr:peptidoglycan DD-metalloendopeptidase family protein [Mucilaginibacter sp. UR6-11]MCC8425021.1 peptidoglycan DD-metalloendopeptidase family protein [Mucilaginibacter sp. UR6-11]
MDASATLAAYIRAHPYAIGKVVDFNAETDKLHKFNLTASNIDLDHNVVWDTVKFSNWINAKLKASNSRYGIGGYMEHRTLYARSPLFDTGDEPRRLHLGIDIWAPAGTPVYSPLAGCIHSFRNNNNFGDYGPTIILQHELDGLVLYSLYGHLNRKSLLSLKIGQAINKNQKIGELGNLEDNGGWPPHLHFQLMFDMEGHTGDYPGVARFSEKARYLKNIPNPNLILRFPKI